jgi:ABC-type transport system substrate-binding protein
MKRIFSTRLAIVSAFSFAAPFCALASARPHYGGTLRVEMRERLNSMDPRGWFAGRADSLAMERMLSQVFERLVALDDSGQIVPALAIAWQHDANFTRWEFVLREGVKFHDGTPANPENVATTLNAEGEGRWSVTSERDEVVFTFPAAHPELLSELISGKSFVFHSSGDTVFGTGPFRIAEWQPQKRLLLIANEDSWGGRPFADRVEIQFGVSPQQQVLDLELGKVDVIDLEPNFKRRVTQSNAHIVASQPVELLALEFGTTRAAADPRLRQALSLSIDRAAIVNVFLQRQGEPAASLLPQWLSGYAFVFSAGPDLIHAKELRSQLAAAGPLSLVYDGSDALAAQVAARVAVNARDTGIVLNVSAEAAGHDLRADLRLVRRRLAAPDAQSALTRLLAQIEPVSANAKLPEIATAQQRYAAERTVLDPGKIVPLAFLPELSAAAPSVHDWLASRWGEWRLADAWLEETQKPASGASGTSGSSTTGNRE